MFFFENPVKALEREKRRAESAIKRAISYKEFKLPKRTVDVGVLAETFTYDNPLEPLFPKLESNEVITDPSGTLGYHRKTLPRGSGLEITEAPSMFIDGGRVYFSDDVIIPSLLYRRSEDSRWIVWMGLSPFEMHSQNSGIRAATRHVVLGGLGMGWLLSQIVKKKTVKDVVVVENNKNLIEWFGQELCAGIPKVKGLIHGDIWKIAPTLDPDCRYLIDIWPSYGLAEWDHNLADLRATGRKCWAWGSPRGPRQW